MTEFGSVPDVSHPGYYKRGGRSKYVPGSVWGLYTIVAVLGSGSNPMLALTCEHGRVIHRPRWTMNNVVKTKRCTCSKGDKPRRDRRKAKARAAKYRQNSGTGFESCARVLDGHDTGREKSQAHGKGPGVLSQES